MIDNFKQISELLQFDSEDDFYFLQIIKRKKEHPDMSKSCRMLKSYYVSSHEQLEKIKDLVIKQCEDEGARAYIHLNRRSFKKCCLHTIKALTDLALSEQYAAAKTAYDKSCGQFSNEKMKTWIVDIDTKDSGIMDEMCNLIRSIEPANKDRIKTIISTKNGYHIISYPFNIMQFKLACTEDIDIHKDNPTILYIPNSITDDRQTN